MNRQGYETKEEASAPSDSFAPTSKVSKGRPRIGAAAFVIFLWLFLAVLILISQGSLTSAHFWATFVAFVIAFSVGALSGDPNPPPDERRLYPLKLSRRQHLVIGVLGMATLVVFVIVLNSPVEKELKWDVLYGATTGGWTAMALSGTYLEFFRGNRRPK